MIQRHPLPELWFNVKCEMAGECIMVVMVVLTIALIVIIRYKGDAEQPLVTCSGLLAAWSEQKPQNMEPLLVCSTHSHVRNSV